MRAGRRHQGVSKKRPRTNRRYGEEADMGSTVTRYDERHTVGATPPVSHPFHLSRIGDRDRETKQRLYLKEESRAEFGGIVGNSPTLKTALDLVSIVAPTCAS